MARLFDSLVEMLTTVSNCGESADGTVIQQRFVRDRLDWVNAELRRGTSLSELSQVLGVPIDVMQDELSLRALRSLLSRHPPPRQSK
jgi:hypothetical protein